MLLPPEEASLFLSLYSALIGFVAGRLRGIGPIVDLGSFLSASREAKARARDTLFDRLSLIDAFVEENPGGFREQELSHATQWEHFVRGDFFVERDLKDYTVFLSRESPPKAYAVLGLTDEIVELIPYPLPTLIRGVLLPWKGRILCDGLFSVYGITFGGSIRRELKESYRQAKALGIILSLEPGWRPEPPKPPRAPKTPAIQRFLKNKCPKKLAEFKGKYGPPYLEMTGQDAREYGLWHVDGTSALDADTLAVYPNVIQSQVLQVYAKDGDITHIGVVGRTQWQKGDFKPPNGQRLMR